MNWFVQLNRCPMLCSPQDAVGLMSFLFFGFRWIRVHKTIDKRPITTTNWQNYWRTRCEFGWYYWNVLHLLFVRPKYGDWSERCIFGNNQTSPRCSNVYIVIVNTNGGYLKISKEISISWNIINSALSVVCNIIRMLPGIGQHLSSCRWICCPNSLSMGLISGNPTDSLISSTACSTDTARSPATGMSI